MKTQKERLYNEHREDVRIQVWEALQRKHLSPASNIDDAENEAWYEIFRKFKMPWRGTAEEAWAIVEGELKWIAMHAADRVYRRRIGRGKYARRGVQANRMENVKSYDLDPAQRATLEDGANWALRILRENLPGKEFDALVTQGCRRAGLSAEDVRTVPGLETMPYEEKKMSRRDRKRAERARKHAAQLMKSLGEAIMLFLAALAMVLASDAAVLAHIHGG